MFIALASQAQKRSVQSCFPIPSISIFHQSAVGENSVVLTGEVSLPYERLLFHLRPYLTSAFRPPPKKHPTPNVLTIIYSVLFLSGVSSQ